MAAKCDPIKAARDEGFNAGTIAALAVVRIMDCGTAWGEIVRAAGTQGVLRHALRNEDDWKWAGFDHYAINELGRAEVARARHAVNAERRKVMP